MISVNLIVIETSTIKVNLNAIETTINLTMIVAIADLRKEQVETTEKILGSIHLQKRMM